ncbi:MAG: FAD:protein FMN transferase [Myxococcota bacterium]
MIAWAHFDAPIMATRIEVVLPEDGASARDAAHVFEVFRRVEQVANEWREDSPLAAVNRAAGRAAVPIPPELHALLTRSLEAARATGGAFDPTWAALWGLWRWDVPRVPAPADVAARVAHVGHAKLELGDGSARLAEEGAALGLGGIAKGWALDRAAEALRARGREDFLLSAGGQVYAAGDREGRPWRVGVRDPRGEREDEFALLEVRDASVSTSGDYERFFVVDGARYHHILDPRTGMPATGARSATVIAAEATWADALSTALVVLGPAEGVALAERMEGVEALMVDARGEVHATTGAPIARMTRPKP